MEIIQPSYEIIDKLDGAAILKKIELCGRVAYKSEKKINSASSLAFVDGIIKRGHESVLEHFSFSVRFICDRGVTHELVRHRLVAYTQESTRYCNYNKRGMTVIAPPFWDAGLLQYAIWFNVMEQCEDTYNTLIEKGNSTPQEARSVLPNSLKTEIIATANLREWRHILKLRTAKTAHPQMRQLMVPLLQELKDLIPIVFDDIKVED